MLTNLGKNSMSGRRKREDYMKTIIEILIWIIIVMFFVGSGCFFYFVKKNDEEKITKTNIVLYIFVIITDILFLINKYFCM